MTIILFRHFEKDLSTFFDPSLSTRGKAQAEALVNHIRLRKLPTPDRLICSPKTRAQESFEPLSQELVVPLEIEPLLNEQQSDHESETDLIKRVTSFIDKIALDSSSARICYVVSHADWLEHFSSHVPTDLIQKSEMTSWSSGSYQIFEIKNSLWLHQGGGHI